MRPAADPGPAPAVLDRAAVRAEMNQARLDFGRLVADATPAATWDPFFTGYMTLADIYRYPTQHSRFHQRQLTLSPPPG